MQTTICHFDTPYSILESALLDIASGRVLLEDVRPVAGYMLQRATLLKQAIEQNQAQERREWPTKQLEIIDNGNNNSKG